MLSREKLKELPIFVTFLICIFLSLMFVLILKVSRYILGLTLLKNYTCFLIQALAELIPILFFILISFFIGFDFIFRENRSGWKYSFYQSGFLTAYCGSAIAVNIVSACHMSGEYVRPWEFIVFIISVFLVGVAEELVFRGIILNLLLDRFPKNRLGITLAIIIDGIFFGMIHFTNIFSGVSISGALIQAFGVSFIGILFAYSYVRTRNLKLVMLLHFLFDFASLLSTGLYSGTDLASSVSNLESLSVGQILTYFLYLIPIFLLLRKANVDKIVLLENNKYLEEDMQRFELYSYTSLVLGIISLLVCFTPGYSIGLSVLGIISNKCVTNDCFVKKNVLNTGLILNIIGLIVGCLSIIFWSL